MVHSITALFFKVEQDEIVVAVFVDVAVDNVVAVVVDVAVGAVLVFVSIIDLGLGKGMKTPN